MFLVEEIEYYFWNIELFDGKMVQNGTGNLLIFIEVFCLSVWKQVWMPTLSAF